MERPANLSAPFATNRDRFGGGYRELAVGLCEAERVSGRGLEALATAGRHLGTQCAPKSWQVSTRRST